MFVYHLNQDMVNSDLGIVNAARVSTKKTSSTALRHGLDFQCEDFNPADETSCMKIDHLVETLSSKDEKLIHYLKTHNHWTPFAHARMCFRLEWDAKDADVRFNFYLKANSGCVIARESDMVDVINASLWWWICSVEILPKKKQDYIKDKLYEKYPFACSMWENQYPSFVSNAGVLPFPEQQLVSKKEWHLAYCTLYLEVPIAVARQIRTSKVGFVYHEEYVEGDAFVFNEQSRRYVDDELEFDVIKKWRVREGDSVKQGSTGEASEYMQIVLRSEQHGLHGFSKLRYEHFRERENIAPEQLRFLLPQSLITKFWMTGTLHRFAQWVKLRTASDVQEETRDVAQKVRDVLDQEYKGWADSYRL